MYYCLHTYHNIIWMKKLKTPKTNRVPRHKQNHIYNHNMDVEIEMYIDEDDETLVMQKVSSLTKQAKDADLR